MNSDDDDENWQQIGTKRKRIVSISPKPSSKKIQFLDEMPSTSTNRFASLSTDEEIEEVEQNNEIDINNDPKPPKPPPIVIPGVVNINKMITELASIVDKKEFRFKSLTDGQIRLLVDNIPSYRKVIQFFEKKGTIFHTYQPKQERAYRIVIKNLHSSTPIDEIRDALLSYGHDPRNISNIKSRETKEALPMFFVDLEPKANNKDVYKLMHINNAIIKIEPPRQYNDIVQCHRCQEFGHTKNFCRKPFRCVKCGLNHPSTTCSNSKDLPVRCVHCNESHTANYKGCLVYKELSAKKNIVLNRNNYPHTNSTNNNNRENTYTTHNSNRTNQFSYADIASNRAENQNHFNNNNQIFERIESLINKQTELVNSLISMMSTLLTKLCK